MRLRQGTTRPAAKALPYEMRIIPLLASSKRTGKRARGVVDLLRSSYYVVKCNESASEKMRRAATSMTIHDAAPIKGLDDM